jgi:phage terminase large subunit-like protein
VALPAGPKKDAGGHIPTALEPLAFAAWWGATPFLWQQPIVQDLCADDRPRVAYVQVGRKNGKSYLAAVIAIDEMVRCGGQVFLIADSERNLKSALFSELQSLVARSPQLSSCVLTYKDHFECPGSGGRISLRPNNLGASQSINPTLVIFDEVHMQRTDQIWNGMVLAGAAAKRGLLLGITTPGYEMVSLAHDLYDQVRGGETWGVIYEAGNTACALDDTEALAEANPVMAEDPDHWGMVYAHERKAVAENDYRRFRLGQWTAVATRWLPDGAWRALGAPREYRAGERLWVGFDGSYSGDSTALVACAADGHLKVLGHWENPKPGSRGWRVPRNEVKAAVDKVMTEHPDATLHPDPFYWQSEIADWDAAWPGRVIEFPCNSIARMAPACSEFEARVLERQLSHDKYKPLEAHLSHCTPKMTPAGVVVVKPSPDSPLKIDLAVAAIIAVSQAVIAPPVPDMFVM